MVRASARDEACSQGRRRGRQPKPMPPDVARSAAMPNVPLPTAVLATPLIRRVVWHLRRVTGQLDRRFFLSLAEGILILVAIAAVLITLLEKPVTFGSLFDSFNWGIATVLGQGDAGYVTSPAGARSAGCLSCSGSPCWR